MSLPRVDPVWPSNGRAMVVSGWFTSRVTKNHAAVEDQIRRYFATGSYKERGELKRATLPHKRC